MNNKNSKQRMLLVATSAALAACTPLLAVAAEGQSARARPVPMIHGTDLFRPHNDPDDHWDLACVYALACQGRIDLRGILIDYPKPERQNDPDVLGVAQLNYLTGRAVPVVVGSPRWMDAPGSASPGIEADLRGVRTMLDMLRRAPAPVVINILGSCRDVALAGRLEPDLFQRKCRAIYLNAGSGTHDKSKAAQLEWNVRLDPTAYSAIFDLPCPIYWMPCFEEIHRSPRDLFQVSEYGTFYRFRQADVLPLLSAGVQRYFATMFRQGQHVPRQPNDAYLQTDWLQSLMAAPAPELMERLGAMNRNMWCTGGFLHSAGLTVTREGRIVPLADATDPVFTFDLVDISCSKDAVTHWKRTSTATNRFLFHVRDLDRYQDAMTSALRSLLHHLP